MTDDAGRSHNAPDYPQQGAAGAPAGQGTDPGRTMGIVGLILGIVGFFIAYLAPIAGIIVSAIARGRSKRAGHKNGLATAGLIVSIVALIANIIVTIVLVSAAINLANQTVQIFEQCQADPTGTVEYLGQTLSCEEFLEQAQR